MESFYTGNPVPFASLNIEQALKQAQVARSGLYEQHGAWATRVPGSGWGAFEIVRETMTTVLCKADELNLVRPACSALKVVLQAMRGAGAPKNELRAVLDIGLSISYNIFPEEPGVLPAKVETLIGRFNHDMGEVARTAKEICESKGYCWQNVFYCHSRRAMGNHLHKLMIIYQLVMGSAVLYNVEMNNVRLALLYDQYVASRPIEMTNGSALGLEVSGVDKDQEVSKSNLGAPGELKPGQQLESDCGRCKLRQQLDGNLVIYENGIPVWATGVSAAVPKGAEVVTKFLANGNLVQCLAYPNGRLRHLWEAQCGRRGGDVLVMNSDGNLVIYRKGGQFHDPDNAIWASDSWLGGWNRGRIMTD